MEVSKSKQEITSYIEFDTIQAARTYFQEFHAT